MLNVLYGKDSRSIRLLNFFIHLMWVYLLSIHLAGLAIIKLPSSTYEDFAYILILSITTVICTLFSFMNIVGKNKLKYISFTLGSCTQFILSAKYSSEYPPFDVMTIVTSLLALWFLVGALYIRHKER